MIIGKHNIFIIDVKTSYIGTISPDSGLSKAFLNDLQTTLVVPFANESKETSGLTVPLAPSLNAFQIIGDSGAARHCRGLDDILLNER